MRLYRLFVFLLSCCALGARADTYELTWTLKPEPKSKSALGSLALGRGAGEIREIDLHFPSTYTDIRADGDLKRKGERAVWTPPRRGGAIHWRVAIEQRRADGAYRSHFPGDWAIFRGDRVFPAATVRGAKGSESRATLVLDLPKGWHKDTPYLANPDGSFRVDDPDRRFDRPVGWMAVGAIGTRRDLIAGSEIALAAPRDEGARRMDMLAFLSFTLPTMKDAFGTLPEKILIVQAPDPMWRGGLSGPRSLYLHLDRPMVSENATSPLLHELTHVATRIRGATDADDWIAEGLAEFYGFEILRRAGGISDERYQRTLGWLGNWGKDVRTLRSEGSKAEVTARAVVLLEDLDREIREQTEERRNLDDVTRRLMKVRKVSTKRFIETAEQVAGGKLRTLDTPLLR